MDKDDKLRLAEIHAMVKTLSVDLQFLRRHRNVLFGTPVLEFNEVGLLGASPECPSGAAPS